MVQSVVGFEDIIYEGLGLFDIRPTHVPFVQEASRRDPAAGLDQP